MESVAPAPSKTLANLLASVLMAALWGLCMALGIQSDPWRGASIPVAIFGSGWLAAAGLLLLAHRVLRRRGWDQVQDLIGILALLARSCAVPLIVGGGLMMMSVWWHAPNLAFAIYLNLLAVLGGFLWGYYDFGKTAKTMGYPRYYPALWGVGLAAGVTVALQGLL